MGERKYYISLLAPVPAQQEKEESRGKSERKEKPVWRQAAWGSTAAAKMGREKVAPKLKKPVWPTSACGGLRAEHLGGSKSSSKFALELWSHNKELYSANSKMDGDEKTEIEDLKRTIAQLQQNLQVTQERLDLQDQEITEYRDSVARQKVMEREEETDCEDLRTILSQLTKRIDQLSNKQDQSEPKYMVGAAGLEVTKSRRRRGLISGLDKEVIAKQFPKNKQFEDTDLEAIEQNMDRVIQEEERHLSRNPRAGEGCYYLQGHTPFWREPWPSNWKVAVPWEYAMQHDHHELQQQFKHLTLDVFNGDKETYPQWQSMFFKTVHVLDMDVDIKYNCLMRHVTEEIKKELIRGISHSASKYCFAICRLEQAYGMDGMQVATTLANLLSLKPFKSYESGKALEFAQHLQGYICACDENNETVAVQSVMPKLLSIIPRDWLKDYLSWTEKAPTEENPETLYAHLRPIVELEKKMLQYDCIREMSPVKEHCKFTSSKMIRKEKPKILALVGSSTAKEPMECHCCQGQHRLKKCPTFYQEFNNRQRRDLMEKLNFCLKCFTSNHKGKGCLNRRRCALCEGDHSTWVHVKEDEKSKTDCIAQVAADGNDESDESELSGDCIGEGFFQEETSEDDEILPHRQIKYPVDFDDELKIGDVKYDKMT